MCESMCELPCHACVTVLAIKAYCSHSYWPPLRVTQVCLVGWLSVFRFVMEKTGQVESIVLQQLFGWLALFSIFLQLSYYRTYFAMERKDIHSSLTCAGYADNCANYHGTCSPISRDVPSAAEVALFQCLAHVAV